MSGVACMYKPRYCTYMTRTETAGQALAATLRKFFSIGTRTQRFRKGMDLFEEMLQMAEIANHYPGYYSEAQHAALQPAFHVACAYRGAVQGGRIDPVQAWKLSEISPYQFAALLGDMLDAGVSNRGAAEMYFRELRAAA